jgi:hypothetical protein
MSQPLIFTFAAGPSGNWQIDRIDAVRGDALPSVERLAVHEWSPAISNSNIRWALYGATSNSRYTHRAELKAMTLHQQGLGRPYGQRPRRIVDCRPGNTTLP